ncbi:MAG: coenzyme F420 biosynthesis-associated protein [Actinobacteria bacterium]|nr:MAG: coenzyme F420 biosynthesis-associated protein [Actinomycetota bacterium]
MMVGMVDWSLTRRIATTVAGQPPPARPRPELPEVVAESERLVAAYAELHPPAPLPPPELLARHQWIDANLRTMPTLLEPLMAKVGEGAGALAPAIRVGAGTVLSAEVGVLLGYVSRRVLGQYDVVILDPDAPARLLFVGPNLDDAARQLAADPDELLRWVALHEVTHAVQFAAVPWLREHLAGLIHELVDSLDVAFDPARLLRLPSGDDVRAWIDALTGDGDLLSLVTTAQQRQTIDRMQATMAVVEGHAEHVMDAVGVEVIPSLDRLREAMERRRAAPSAPARLLQRLLGFDVKLRQYKLGKRFCDEVVALDGLAALNRVWTDPGMIPTLDELENPRSWLNRTRVPSVTKS